MRNCNRVSGTSEKLSLEVINGSIGKGARPLTEEAKILYNGALGGGREEGERGPDCRGRVGCSQGGSGQGYAHE